MNPILRNLRTTGLGAFVLAVVFAAPAAASTITIVNNNAAGVGFNDPTVVAPVGGNPGTTLGAQRLFVFQTAANQWGGMLQSTVPILVRAQFSALTCTATSATLGSTSVVTSHANFAGAPFANTWYPQALANSIAGTDLSAANPDISTSFNSSIDTGCFSGSLWYYGLDGNEGTNIELLPVVLHELAHGLGFSTTTNANTGNFNGGMPSIYDRFLLDNTTGLHWNAETAAQRQASAIALNKLVWDGSNVQGMAATFLGKRPELLVNSPAVIAGEDTMASAAFGATATVGGVTGNVVLVDDGTAPSNTDACEPLVNGAAVAGNWALLDRGTCTFVIKAQQAQAAGAIGVIVGNNAPGLTANPLGGSDPTITIPVVGITLAAATTMKANLAGGVNVTFKLHPTEKAGADALNHPLMYTPNPFASGSTVSHYDVSVTPNALMEPFINSDLHNSVDMTLPLMRDIGWLDIPTATVLNLFTAESQSDGILLRWQFSEDAVAVRTVTVERATSSAGPFAPVPAGGGSDGDFTTALDATAQPGITYWYRLGVLNAQGGTDVYGLVSGIRNQALAGEVYFGAPSPNPASHDVSFSYRLGRPDFVRLVVSDASGRRVRTLREGMMAAGEYTQSWDGRGEGQVLAPAGVYFLSLRTSAGIQTRRVAYLR